MTDTTAVDRSAQLIEYAKAAPKVAEAKEAYEAAMASVTPLREAYEQAVEGIRELAVATGDPFEVLKTKGKGAGRKTGPRDPNRRIKVLSEFAKGATIREVADATSEDPGYVNSVVNAKNTGFKDNPKEWSRSEDRPYSYTFTGEIPSEA